MRVAGVFKAGDVEGFLASYVPTLMWLTGELMKRPSRFP
ncbi:MAG: hypothetical protein CM15mP74_33870 [Halieaceae bacterium]|nr:MAG: hypothetical protein CM15mP74_33870 [Halieaceae bacterium]